MQLNDIQDIRDAFKSRIGIINSDAGQESVGAFQSCVEIIMTNAKVPVITEFLATGLDDRKQILERLFQSAVHVGNDRNEVFDRQIVFFHASHG